MRKSSSIFVLENRYIGHISALTNSFQDQSDKLFCRLPGDWRAKMRVSQVAKAAVDNRTTKLDKKINRIRPRGKAWIKVVDNSPECDEVWS